MERKIDRLIKYMTIKGLNDNQVTKECGLSVGLLNQARKGKSDLGDKAVEKILKKYQDIERVWLLTGEGSMLKSDGKKQQQPGKGIPFYDQDFACGFLEIPEIADRPASYVNLPGTEKATCWCRATGISMQPLIDNGDYVCLQRIDDPIFLVFGETYAFDCINGMRTIKKLGRGSEPDSFRLIPVNKEVDEQDIPKSVIRHIFRVVAVAKYL